MDNFGDYHFVEQCLSDVKVQKKQAYSQFLNLNQKLIAQNCSETVIGGLKKLKMERKFLVNQD